MTVASENSRITYAGDGTTTAFTVNFYFLSNTDLTAILTTSAGVQTTLVLNTDYTLTGAGSSSGGTLTCTTAPASGATLQIIRIPAYTQETDYTPNDPFPAESHERALDKLTMLAQRLKDLVSRAVHIADGDATGASTLLPTPTANKILGWDQNGTALLNYDVQDFTSTIAGGTFTTQTFSGNGSTTSFTLSQMPVSVSALEVFISGVRQKSGADYNISGTTLLFSSAPASGTGNIFCRWGSAAILGYDEASLVNFNQGAAGSVTISVEDALREKVSVKRFGAHSTDEPGYSTFDNAAAINAAIVYVFSIASQSVWLNGVPDHGNIVLDLGGREYLIQSPILFPTEGGGGVTIQNGRLRAGASFDPARYLIEANTSNIAFHFITFQNLVLDGAHIAGCLQLYKYHNFTITNCFFIHYGTIGVRAVTAGDSLNINSCYFYEYLYGETGFETNGVLKARALHLGNADSSVLNCVFGFGKEGIYVEAGLNRIQQCHFYGLNDWTIFQTNSASNIWITDNYFDAPSNANSNSQVFLANPYEVVLTNNKFNYLVANGTCVSVFPTASGRAFSGFIATGNRFSIGSYTPNGTLTLSSAAYGIRTLTFSVSYATQNMIGSVIKEKNSGSGVAVIINYTNATTVIVQVQKPFSSSSISAGNWDHIPNSIFVDERNHSIGTTITNSAVKDNFFAGAQPRYTEVTVKEIMNGVATSGEVSVGHVLLVQNAIDHVVLTYTEGSSGTVYSLKPYYFPAARSVVAWASNSAIPSPAPMYVKCHCSADQI